MNITAITERLRTTVSSTVNGGVPATIMIPVGGIRNMVLNTACLTRATLPSTFESLAKRAAGAERTADVILNGLDRTAKMHSQVNTDLKAVIDGPAGSSLAESTDCFGEMAAALNVRLAESHRGCIVKAIDVSKEKDGTYRPDNSTPFGGVAIDFAAVEQERRELLALFKKR